MVKLSVEDAGLMASFHTDLQRVKESSRALARYLNQEAHAVWCWFRPPEDSPNTFIEPDHSRDEYLRRVGDALTHIFYDKDLKVQPTDHCPGVIAVDRQGLALAKEMNAARRDLAKSLKAMNGRHVIKRPYGDGKAIKVTLRQHAQQSAGAALLNFYQATRQIKCYSHALSYVGFTWANLRKILVKPVAAVLDEMEFSDEDIELLEKLKPTERVAIVTGTTLAPKANITYYSRKDRKDVSKVVRSALPLLYLGSTLPARFKPLRAHPPDESYERMQRSDIKLEQVPYLSSRLVYRFKQEFRTYQESE